MSRKTDRTKLLEQIFAGRLPRLDATTQAAAALTEAAEAVNRAEARRRYAAENLRSAYDDAVAAGWTEVVALGRQGSRIDWLTRPRAHRRCRGACPRGTGAARPPLARPPVVPRRLGRAWRSRR